MRKDLKQRRVDLRWGLRGRRTYGFDLYVINWGMHESTIAKLQWYRSKPELKVLTTAYYGERYMQNFMSFLDRAIRNG